MTTDPLTAAKTEAAKLLRDANTMSQFSSGSHLQEGWLVDRIAAALVAHDAAGYERGLREAIAELQSRAIEGAADKFNWCRAVAAIEGLLIRAKFTCPDCGANRVGGDKWCWNCKRSWPTEQPPAPTTDNPDWEELCKEEAHLRDEAETKVAEQAKEIAALRAALKPFIQMDTQDYEISGGQWNASIVMARAALSKEPA